MAVPGANFAGKRVGSKGLKGGGDAKPTTPERPSEPRCRCHRCALERRECWMCVANSVTDTEMCNPMTAPLLAGKSARLSWDEVRNLALT